MQRLTQVMRFGRLDVSVSVDGHFWTGASNPVEEWRGLLLSRESSRLGSDGAEMLHTGDAVAPMETVVERIQLSMEEVRFVLEAAEFFGIVDADSR